MLVYFEIQDGWNWRSVSTAEEGISQQGILIEMQNVSRMYPGYRVRCVDETGRLLDTT